MSFGSFEKLVGLLKESLMVEQEMVSLWGGAIIPEGGLYTDVFYLIGISQSFHCNQDLP